MYISLSTIRKGTYVRTYVYTVLRIYTTHVRTTYVRMYICSEVVVVCAAL